jgi:hypothetical protein
LSASAALAADLVRESRTVDARVTRVKLDGVVDLVGRQGAQPSLVISGERADVARVTTHQQGETLEIDTERRNSYARADNPKLRAELVVPNLAEFVSEGEAARGNRQPRHERSRRCDRVCQLGGEPEPERHGLGHRLRQTGAAQCDDRRQGQG